MTSRRDAPPASPAGAHARVADVWRRAGVRRFSKYAAGSVVAFAVSNLVFLVCYGLGWTSPQVASVLSFTAGVPVNYVLNRRWAWQRRGRPTLRGELVPYGGVVAFSIAATALGTWATDRWLQAVDVPRAVQVVIVDVAFIAINGGLFLTKYVLLDRLVFTERRATTARPAGDDRAPDVERVP